jgi:menaquinone-dependent protoporphyrinogen oxidase
MGKWLDDVAAYVRRHEALLKHRPTWLFASGPVGKDRVDKQGHDLLAPPPFLTAAARDIGARGARVFFGRWDPADPPMSLAERLFRMVNISREVLPVGDFREWPEIEAWAREIAAELKAAPVATA